MIGMVLGLAAVAAQGPQTPGAARDCRGKAVPAACVAGSWSGQLGGGEFVFELTPPAAAGGAWSGRYRSFRAPSWHPLIAPGLDGATMSFGFESQPPVRFVLKPDTDGSALDGTMQAAGFDLPFHLARRR